MKDRIENAREQFFYDNAGYSYDPLKETAEQGRIRCAKNLAAAELYARELNWYYVWEPYEDGDHSYLEDGQTVESCEWCQLCYDDEDGEQTILASLGCIDDATSEYRRVIEAELASEAMGRELAEAQRIQDVDSFIDRCFAL